MFGSRRARLRFLEKKQTKKQKNERRFARDGVGSSPTRLPEELTLHDALVHCGGGRVGHSVQEGRALVAASRYPGVQRHFAQQREIQIGAHSLGAAAGGREDLGRVLEEKKKKKKAML